MPNAFWRLTFFELSALIDNKEEELLNDWRQSRFIGVSALNSNPYLKKPFEEMSILPLTGDPKPKKMNRKDFNENVKKMKNALPFNVA